MRQCTTAKHITDAMEHCMGELINFPNKRKINTREKVDRLEHRLSELETENAWVRQDIVELGQILEKNITEMQELLHELAVLQGFEEKYTQFDEETEEHYRNMEGSEDSDDIEPDF